MSGSDLHRSVGAPSPGRRDLDPRGAAVAERDLRGQKLLDDPGDRREMTRPSRTGEARGRLAEREERHQLIGLEASINVVLDYLEGRK